MLATIVLSQGMPMILHGDECGRTQGGNDNGYDQDNDTSWLHWDTVDTERLGFTRRLLQLRRAHAVFRRRRFFLGADPGPGDTTDLAWFGPAGTPMGQWDWDAQENVTVTAYLNGDGIGEPDADGNPMVDDSFLVMVNTYWETVPFVIPPGLAGPWNLELDTSVPGATPTGGPVEAGATVNLPGRSMLVLRRGRVVA
jgi:glycogen operon protein